MVPTFQLEYLLILLVKNHLILVNLCGLLVQIEVYIYIYISYINILTQYYDYCILGYHSHVDSLEQVTASVYKYVLVLARPLVLQAKTNPLSWTHVYLDDTVNSLINK